MNDPVQLLSAAEAIWLAGQAVNNDFETTVRKVVQAAKAAWKKPLVTLPGYETYLEPSFKAWIEKTNETAYDTLLQNRCALRLCIIHVAR